MDADFLVIDEIKGRKISRQNNVRIIGLLGILVKTKNEKYIPEVKAILDEIIEKTKFRIDPILYHQVLESVGEI